MKSAPQTQTRTRVRNRIENKGKRSACTALFVALLRETPRDDWAGKPLTKRAITKRFHSLVKRFLSLGLSRAYIGRVKSVLQNEIRVFSKGSTPPQILLVGAVHAREWVTELVVEELARAYGGETGIMFVPSANPDGVALAKYGLNARFDTEQANAAFEVKKEYLTRVNGGTDFSLWKANANAVDVNVNFPAAWGTGRQNVRRPAPESYVGTMPASEPETRALMELSRGMRVAIAFHTKGEVIYHGFGERKQTALAAPFAYSTGYALLESAGSAGGFKDWFVQEGGFGLTVEVGSDSLAHPVTERSLPAIMARVKEIPALAVRALAALDG